MHFIDLSIFVSYMLAMLGVGFYFLKKNEGADDYYVGGRNMSSGHIGLSVVATDVVGGFSIGLGGFGYYFNARVALLAGIISAIGYTGFTSSQILAGAKLASGTINGLDITTALLIMGVIAVVYTVMGGMKAVIYTDTIQWAILMGGLIFIGLPVSFLAVGGLEQLSFANLTSWPWLT